VTTNQSDDFSQLKNLAEQGNSDAQFRLGSMYLRGQDIRRNLAKSREWFQKAADHGHGCAQFNLGVSYLSEAIMQKSPLNDGRHIKTLAYFWLLIAFSNGHKNWRQRLFLYVAKILLSKDQRIEIEERAQRWPSR
jgi:TPR repeat protein